MLLGFKRRFAPMVEDGSKTHTIRAKRAQAPKVGEVCHCYVDPRQKSMRLLGRFPCVKVQDIRIEFHQSGGFPVDIWITIDGEQLSHDEANELAWRDGFRTPRRSDAWVAMFHFWMETHGRLPFYGDLIHWRFSR